MDREAAVIVLGVDTGNRTFGWARFDSEWRCFNGLGARELEPGQGVQKTDDQGDRAITMAAELCARLGDVELMVVERMSFPPAGMVPIALGFAVAVGVARAAGIPIRTVKPQVWQRAVLPGSGKRVDYAELERVLGEFVRRDPKSAFALDTLAPRLRNHALDACAIAMMGALQLGACRLVQERAVS